MRKRIAVLIAALTAVVAIGAGSATATRMTASRHANLRITSS